MHSMRSVKFWQKLQFGKRKKTKIRKWILLVGGSLAHSHTSTMASQKPERHWGETRPHLDNLRTTRVVTTRVDHLIHSDKLTNV